MALPKLLKTKYMGLKYYKDKIKGKVYVAVFTVYGKKYRKILGYENDKYKTNATIAFIKKENLKNEIINGNFISEDMNFHNLWNLYLDHIINSKTCSLKTIQTKTSAYTCHFKDILDKKKISNIKNYDIQQIANKLLKNKKPKTAHNYISDLSTIFQFAIKHNLINSNPARNIELPKFDNIKVFPLNETESKSLFNTIINYHEPLFKGIFTFLLHGRRKNEVLSITWDMIDLEKKTYTIKYELNKVRKNMTYELSDILYDLLISMEDKKGLVFKSPVTGKQLKNIRYAWYRILKKANIEKAITIHEIRHLIGETSVNALNSSLEVVAAVLGQTSTRATKRYAKVRKDISANALKDVFDYLRSKNS